MDPLFDDGICRQLAAAWRDSQPDVSAARHEEGGYITQGADGSLSLDRWPRGMQARIVPPPLEPENRYNGKMVIATFHTHPNPSIDEEGQRWEQAPSLADRRWHQRRSLPGLVVARSLVYRIDSSGGVSVVGPREEVLS